MAKNHQSFPQITHANDFDGYCFALGYIQTNWAQMEQMFDSWIAMIYHNIGGRDMVDNRLPRSFGKKIEFLRKAFKKIRLLNEYAGKAIPLLNRAKALSRQRNDLTHGALSSLEPVDGKWQMIILDFDASKDNVNWHVPRNFAFSPSDFQNLESKLVPLSLEVGEFGRRLLALVRSKL